MARGGFGASDLFDYLDFDSYQSMNIKPLVCGFSDVSAFLSAFYALLDAKGVHMPMPFTSQYANFQNVCKTSKKLLENFIESGFFETNMKVSGPPVNIDGKLFGGNLAVLTNLIGTRFIPQSLEGHILMFEDISEHPARVIRFLNQWRHAGLLEGVRAIVLGDFKEDLIKENCNEHIAARLSEDTSIPIFTTSDFGHSATNYPFAVGEMASIGSGVLTQNFSIT